MTDKTETVCMGLEHGMPMDAPLCMHFVCTVVFVQLCNFSVMAYLSISATFVPSELVLSSAGDIVSGQRSQLLIENVDMLIFWKKNMAMSCSQLCIMLEEIFGQSLFALHVLREYYFHYGLHLFVLHRWLRKHLFLLLYCSLLVQLHHKQLQLGVRSSQMHS